MSKNAVVVYRADDTAIQVGNFCGLGADEDEEPCVAHGFTGSMLAQLATELPPVPQPSG